MTPCRNCYGRLATPIDLTMKHRPTKSIDGNDVMWNQAFEADQDPLPSAIDNDDHTDVMFGRNDDAYGRLVIGKRHDVAQ